MGKALSSFRAFENSSWSELVLIRASAGGALAAVFSEYLLRSIGCDPATHVRSADAAAALALIGAAVIDIRSLRLRANGLFFRAIARVC